jgi:hypothetical protein
MRKRGKFTLLTGMVAAFALLFGSIAVASDLDVAALDADTPLTEVTLAAGEDKAFTIDLEVTGRQGNGATFRVYRDWTLQSDGTFVGSNPSDLFAVPAREAQAAAWTASVQGKVIVPAGQADRGPDMLTIAVHDLTTSAPGALSMRDAAEIEVTVVNPTVGDTTPPVIAINGPADGAVYTLGQVVNADYTCTDAESAVTKCEGPVANGAPIDTATVGSKSFRVDAESAGGASDLTHTYRVVYDFGGFLRPIDDVNVAKAGRAIPVKFSLDGDQGLDIMAPGFPKAIACDLDPQAVADEDPVPTVTAGSSSLAYDALTDQYTYVWKTDKGWANSCRTLVVRFVDGQTHTAQFHFTM